MFYRLQQFLYELFFGRDICKQFDYMNKKPYKDGFFRGIEIQKTYVNIIIDLLEKDQKRNSKVVTDRFIIDCIKKMW